LDLVAENSGLNEHLGSHEYHPVLDGFQTNLYANFIEQSWRSVNSSGVIGLIHKDGHLLDADATALRGKCYARLRLHAEFTNKLKLFPDVSTSREFSVNVYGSARPPQFK